MVVALESLKATIALTFLEEKKQYLWSVKRMGPEYGLKGYRSLHLLVTSKNLGE